MKDLSSNWLRLPLSQLSIVDSSITLLSLLLRFNGVNLSDFDSEPQERMVVYQAIYGEMAYWVRQERMFFRNVTRDGRTLYRFTEIDR